MAALPDDEVRRILVVKLSSLGDVVHATPCLRALRHRFPQADITLAVERAFAAVVRRNPHIDRLLEIDAPRPGKWRKLQHARARLSSLGSDRFDLAIDLQGVWRSALYVYLSGARFKAGRGSFRPGWRLSLEPDPGQHAVRVCAAVMEALGVAVPHLGPTVYCCPAADASLAHKLAAQRLPGRDFVMVNPFSRWRSKDWPLPRYAELIRRLHASGAGPVIVTGGPEEMDRGDELMALLRSAEGVSLVGRLTLDEAICLYGRAGLMVTGDSGPMHIAAALGTPLVALFGPTLPERTGPWGQSNAVLQRSRPAHHHRYRTDRRGEHIGAITVDDVYEAVAICCPRRPEAGG